jgi:hypothetical protein
MSADLEMPIRIVKRQIGQMERMMGDLAEVVRFGAGKLALVKQCFLILRST